MTPPTPAAARRLRPLFLSAALALAALPLAARAQDDHAGHHPPAGQPPEDHGGHAPPETDAPQPAEDHSGHRPPPAQDHSGHDMPATAEDHAGRGAPAAAEGHSGHAMPGLLGDYPMGRDASGTSWRPDVSGHGGVHGMAGGWMLMAHARLDLVYSWQDGPRGDEEVFVGGMVMGSAQRSVGADGTLTLRAMLSPDPFMGKDGYPLLLAAGETADGVTPLVDRQHPHDLFMELSVAYAHRLGPRDSVFLYAGLPGEPAFGPPAFMHRDSGLDSPIAPISHHWLDSTHITFGVVTAGWVHDRWKVEASTFRGREPDEDRFDIEDPDFDSWSARLSWNPADRWSLQASYAAITSPEQLEPGEDERRWSASAIHTAPLAGGGWWSTTAAWGRKIDDHGEAADAWLLETALKPRGDPWTFFARAERVESHELTPGPGHGDIHSVAKVSLGAVYDVRLAGHVRVGVGGLWSFNFVPSELEPLYDGDPNGAALFVRLKVE